MYIRLVNNHEGLECDECGEVKQKQVNIYGRYAGQSEGAESILICVEPCWPEFVKAIIQNRTIGITKNG